MRILAGKTKGMKYRHVDLEDTVGKTVQAIGLTKVDSDCGKESCIVLMFTDGTKHGFVVPAA